MGEPVCLRRSFSQPAQISPRDEVVGGRVLTESVSFGRFASETLQWAKWSAFTQNRYLEEVERFTKPGSVAQKKAFFEAHFKNRAAGRATQMEIQDDSLIEVSNSQVDSVVPSVSVIHNLVDPPVEVDSVASSIGEVKATNAESFGSMALVPQVEALTEDNSTSLSKEIRPTSSGRCTTSKLESSLVAGLDMPLKKTRKEPPSCSKRSISVPRNRNRSCFGMSITCAPSSNTEKDIAELPQDDSRSGNNAKGAEKAGKKKRPGLNSVHKSVNFASSARQTTKTVPKNLARNSTTQETTSSNATNEPTGASKSRKRPLSRTATESSRAAKCSTSTSALRLSEFPPSNTRLSEDKRKNTTVGSRVSCRIPNNAQRQSSAGSETLPTQSRTRTKLTTVSSPFNFRSDKRAEKRKEFFKKLEEKKEQLSCGFKPNQNTHLASEEHRNSQVGGSKVSLVSLTSPRLFCRDQNSGKENIIKSHRKVSSTKSIDTRNAAMEKHKHCKIHPSQTKKKTQENLSPNILQLNISQR